MKSLRNLENPFYFAMRLVAGALFAFHGMTKLFGWFGHGRAHEPLMIAAGIIELVCGLFVAVGFLARFAALLACGEMAVAYFQVHAHKGLMPMNNGGEVAVLYCFIFLFICAYGGGKWSFDKS